MTRAFKRDGDAQPWKELPVAGLREQKPGDSQSPVEDWRDLARRIQHETDSNVMIELIQQLVVKLDAEKSRKKKADEE